MTKFKSLALVVALALGGHSQAQVFAPGDTILGGQTDGANFNVGTAGLLGDVNNWPFAETPANAIDGVGQKYLNFAKTNTGFVITPSLGSSLAENITFWTANDAPERDPASFELWGTNVTIGGSGPFPLSDFDLIASGALELPDGRNDAGGVPLNNENSQSVAFVNTTSYTGYMVIFPDVKNASVANSMQIAEVQLNVGPTRDNSMSLQVNTGTGFVTIENGFESMAMDIDSYQIESPGGAPDPSGWFSLQDNPTFPGASSPGAGDGWEEGGGSSSTRMAEAYLLGSSTIGVSESVSLGMIYDRSVAAADLQFKFTLSDGRRMTGLVQYFSEVPSCDFDDNMVCNIDDLNALLAEGPIADGVAVTPGVNDQFDLNGDDVIDNADRDLWLSSAASQNGLSSPYKIGDANLDGSVDVSDFNSWNGNKFTSTLQWDAGDFNGDGSADVSDFNAWNGNKFQSSNGVSAVPEPQAVWIALVGLCTAPVHLRQRHSIA